MGEPRVEFSVYRSAVTKPFTEKSDRLFSHQLVITKDKGLRPTSTTKTELDKDNVDARYNVYIPYLVYVDNGLAIGKRGLAVPQIPSSIVERNVKGEEIGDREREYIKLADEIDREFEDAIEDILSTVKFKQEKAKGNAAYTYAAIVVYDYADRIPFWEKGPSSFEGFEKVGNLRNKIDSKTERVLKYKQRIRQLIEKDLNITETDRTKRILEIQDKIFNGRIREEVVV